MSTTVTGTLVDQKGQVWSLASVQFRLQKAPNSNDRYTLNDAPFNLTPSPVIANAAGAFSIVLPANNEISPDTSSWQCTITPDATSEAVVLVFKLITGALDISATFAAVAKISPINSKFVPRAYVDSEVVIPPNAGQLYYNVTEKTLKYYESGVWVPVGGGGGGGGSMVYPPSGVAVSTGNSWAASIDPATIPRTNASNTFTQPNTFSSNVVVGGDFGVWGITYLSSNTLRISNRSNVGIPSPGSPSISTDATNLVINSSPAGGIYLNWDAGQGIYFGDGAEHTVASLDNAGNVLFTGSISSYNKIDINGAIIGRTGLTISGVSPIVNGSFKAAFVNETTYLDSIAVGSNRAAFSIRQSAANGGNLLETINIDPNGTMLLRGVLNLSSNSSAGITVGSQGTTHTWNIASGNGETDVINMKGGGSGGFRWYNVPDGSVVNQGTPYLMSLNHQSYLDVRGGGSFQLGLVVTQDLTVGGNSQIGGNLQTGSLQVNGAAPAGYVLTSNGSTFTAQPPASTTAHLVVNVDSIPARSYNQVYQNGSSGILIVSGAGGTASDKTASVQCFIGSSNPPTISAFATTIGSSTNSGVVGWNFTVPPGWYYKISPNTLVHPGDVGVVNIYNWIETAVTIA